MKRGLLLLAIAIALVVAFGLFLRDLSTVDRWYVESAAEEADEHRREAYNQISEFCLSLPAAQAQQCMYQARNTAYQQEHEDADLAAQRQMAMWTKWMGIAAFFAILVSIAGVFLVWTTFRETRRANTTARKEFARARLDARNAAKSSEAALKIGNKSALAAAKQVKIAQETAYRELRAYLSVQEVRVSEVGTLGLNGQIVIRNAGHTPAAVEVYFMTDIREFPLLDPREGGRDPLPHWQHKPFINRESDEEVFWWYPVGGSDDPARATVIAEAKGKIARLLGEPKKFCFYLYGRIEFTDYMRRNRTLHFSFRSSGQINIGEPFTMVPMPSGNEYEERAKA